MFGCWRSGACLYCPPASALMSPGTFVRKHELSFWFSVPSTAATMARLRMLAPKRAGTPPREPILRGSAASGIGRDVAASSAQFHRREPLRLNRDDDRDHRLSRSGHRDPRRGVVPIGLRVPSQQAAVIVMYRSPAYSSSRPRWQSTARRGKHASGCVGTTSMSLIRTSQWSSSPPNCNGLALWKSAAS
jgi:hypothetical protein